MLPPPNKSSPLDDIFYIMLKEFVVACHIIYMNIKIIFNCELLQMKVVNHESHK